MEHEASVSSYFPVLKSLGNFLSLKYSDIYFTIYWSHNEPQHVKAA